MKPGPRGVSSRAASRWLVVLGVSTAAVLAGLYRVHEDASLEERAPTAAPPGETPDISEEERDQRAHRTTQAIDRVLAAESRDPSWSADTERRLRDRFASAGLGGAHLDDSRCGSTICRVRVRFDSLEARDGIQTVTDLVDWSSDLLAVVDPQDRRRIVVYATREPGQFPSLD
jgi:hypothetical protein